MRDRILAGFALLRDEPVPSSDGKDHNTIATPIGTRLMRLIRLPHGWRVWTATRDFKFGSYLELFDDGRILNCTTRHDEGDECYWARPSDKDTRNGIR